VRFVPGSLIGDAKDRVVQVSRSLFLWFCFDIVGVGSNELRGPMQSLVDVRGVDAAVRASLLVDAYKWMNASNETIMINRDDATRTGNDQRTRVRECKTCPISEISSM
jgi:hypothetical protein